MVAGMPNIYQLSPLTKMMMSTNDEVKLGRAFRLVPCLGSTFSVLYNPQSLRVTRKLSNGKNTTPGEKAEESSKIPNINGQNLNNGFVQEILETDLFIDTMSAGPEIYGATDAQFGAKTLMDPVKFLANSQVPAATKFISAKEYVDEFMDLLYQNSSSHTMKSLWLRWGAGFSFKGFLVACAGEYTKFSDLGVPVRATLHCVFAREERLAPKGGPNEFQSPDTSKFHTVEQGERLSDLALEAYDDAGAWRHIAQANGMVNPRMMQTGRVLHMPAIP